MFKGEALKTIAGIVLGIIGITVVGAFFFYSEKVKVERSLVDVATHCPLEQSKSVWGLYQVDPPRTTRRTAVLIDATDRIPKEQRDSIGKWFVEEFTKSLVRFERIAIYEILPQDNYALTSIQEPHFDQCAPPFEANKWIENPRAVRRAFEKKFMEKKLYIIRSLASQKEKKWSPILEIVDTLYRDYDRIVLVSDLMQNTPRCSLYKIRGRKRHFSRCGIRSLGRQKNTELSVVYLIREKIGRLQDDSLIRFWQEFAETRGGTFALAYEPPIIK